MTEAFISAVESIMKNNEKLIIQSGIAKNVSDDKFDVQLYVDVMIYDVRINAVTGSLNNYLKVVPKENSKVLIALVENSETEAVLLATSEIEKIEAKVNDMEFVMESGKVSFKNGNADLKEILTGLTGLKDAIIQTPAGPGNFSPNDVQKLTQIETKINNLFA